MHRIERLLNSAYADLAGISDEELASLLAAVAVFRARLDLAVETRARIATMRVCAPCWAHYGDTAPCDEGRPANSSHRKGVPLPKPGDYRVCDEGPVCSYCGQWPHHPDCSARPHEEAS